MARIISPIISISFKLQLYVATAAETIFPDSNIVNFEFG